MEQRHIDTLVNTIACELAFFRRMEQHNKDTGNESGAAYWAKEAADLEALDAVIWDHLQ